MKVFNDRNSKTREMISYLFFGVLTTLVNYAVYFFSTKILGIHYLIANLMAWFLSVLFAFGTNRLFVFRSKNKDVLREGLTFFGGRIVSGVSDMALMYLLVSVMKVNEDASKLAVSVIVVILNYIISKRVVFKNKESI